MGSSPKYKLLLLAVLGLFLMSFTNKSIKEPSSRGYSLYSHINDCDFESISSGKTIVDDIKSLIIKDDIDLKKAHFKNKQFQYRKKFKRWIPGFAGFKPPVKYIQVVPFNLYSKATYSKPYFLSHLHHFLFLLTPF